MEAGPPNPQPDRGYAPTRRHLFSEAMDGGQRPAYSPMILDGLGFSMLFDFPQ
jgi:hypothetical protein